MNRGEGTRQDAPVTLGEGGPCPLRPRRGLGGRAAETRGERLFTKNTGPCEAVRRCIRTDACPVLEGQEDPSAPRGGEGVSPSPSKRRW